MPTGRTYVRNPIRAIELLFVIAPQKRKMKRLLLSAVGLLLPHASVVQFRSFMTLEVLLCSTAVLLILPHVGTIHAKR